MSDFNRALADLNAAILEVQRCSTLMDARMAEVGEAFKRRDEASKLLDAALTRRHDALEAYVAAVAYREQATT